jgi:hypothetical protein
MSTEELSCIAQACMSSSLSFFDRLSVDPCEEVFALAFYSSRLGSYNKTWGPTGGAEVVETLYNI